MVQMMIMLLKTRTSPVRGNETFFTSNSRHVTRMTETSGFVHTGGDRNFDDKVVGNYHSKLGPASWRFSTPEAWTQNDFNALNLAAVRAGGHMTWEGSVPRSRVDAPLSSTDLRPLRNRERDFLRATDDYIAQNEAPERPSWCRAFTDLPAATIGQNYSHTLREGLDFYDENNEITGLAARRAGFFSSVPAWLTITEDPNRPGDWILSGTPTNPSAETLEFNLTASNENGFSAERGVEIQVNGADGDASFEPILIDPIVTSGLVAEWRFDEGSGEVVADSISGQYQATRATGEWIDSPCGGAMLFDGTQAGVILPAGAFSDISATNEVTVSMWVKGDLSQAVADTIFNAEDAADNRILNIHLPWVNERVFWDAGNAVSLDRIGNLATRAEYEGSWRHWVFTKNSASGEMSIYLDGEQWHIELENNAEIGEITSAVLGNNVAGGSGFRGAIDEVRLYSRTLNSEEVRALKDSYDEKSGYDAWLRRFSGTSDEGATNTGINEDFDGDGVSNLLEYVLNGDPSVRERQSILPRIVLSEDAGYVFRFTRNVEALNNTTQNFQYSTNLDGNWNLLEIPDTSLNGITITELPDNLQEVEVPLEATGLTDGPRLFGRLQVLLNE